MIDVETASQLLDYSVRIGEGHRAQEQLEGAVAIHNLLQTQKVAYLADEVGMGKTYVALGALALFRHFQPDFRVLVIAPRENIQNKWMKELRNFVSTNVRFPDLRVKALDGRPARPLVACNNMLELVRETLVDSNRDFFTRLSSFSLPLKGPDTVDPKDADRLRDEIMSHLPWLHHEIFDRRNKQTFKDNFAKALCCALPQFDLVIVDEGHNLKHGFGTNVSARNRVLGLAMGHPDSEANRKLFPGFSPRARRVLFLSATPVEGSYRQLWNQLDIFGIGGAWSGLAKTEVDEDDKKALASEFLIRRVTSVRVGGVEHTKNLYRREWRRGGVYEHDEPILVDDTRQRMVVALVQKKVSELLGHERFNASFQIGMLASFESFLETTKLKREDVDVATFDDSEQTENAAKGEKEGIDVADINRLSRSYRKRFGHEMPHPKMDAMVDSLANSWIHGKKTLVFVRRVASVKELKRKLEERYDQWLMARLFRELPLSLHSRLQGLFEQYQMERLKSETSEGSQSAAEPARSRDDADHGGNESFFAWFFRGEGPSGVISGANIQQRFIQRGAVYATFFEDNHVADLLGCRPGQVQDRLTAVLGVSKDALRAGLQDRSKNFLSQARKHARADRYEAVQAAAIEWLKDHQGPLQDASRIVWHERYESSIQHNHASQAPDIGEWLELPTFFTEIRLRPELQQIIWPDSCATAPRHKFRERELRGQLLASAARLGHSLIDIYVMTIRRLGSLELRAQESSDDEGPDRDLSRIHEYLDLLESQMRMPLSSREWGSFDELADIAKNFELILDVNAPEARERPLSETVGDFGRKLLRQQQPVAGMSGQVNQTLVRQFRMPGYPLVLISTDLLQEGEDLHTFCSSVQHYGISWTASSMEQRIGRIDRVRSQTDRRLSRLDSDTLCGDDKLQVYFPHLEDTIEVLQVQRVLERMNVFLRLMHEGLTTAGKKQRSINANHEFAKTRRVVPQILEHLKSAFPVRSEHLLGTKHELICSAALADELGKRFANLASADFPRIKVSWETQHPAGILLGTVHMTKRIQPFTLLLRSIGPRLLVRCVSPVGCVAPGDAQDSVVESAATAPMKVGAIMTREDRTYDLTVEGDVVLADNPETDADRVGMLVQRITEQADFLEQAHLPGKDESLTAFRENLAAEGTDGR